MNPQVVIRLGRHVPMPQALVLELARAQISDI